MREDRVQEVLEGGDESESRIEKAMVDQESNEGSMQKRRDKTAHTREKLESSSGNERNNTTWGRCRELNSCSSSARVCILE